MSERYIDKNPFDSDILDRACEVCHTYAEKQPLEDYKHLLIICGTPKALKKYTRKHNGNFIHDLEGTSFKDTDERIYELFDRMQKPEGGHRDLALSFDDRGVVFQNSAEIVYEELNNIEPICDEVTKIKGEVGAGHIVLIRGSKNPGMLFGIGLSEGAGTVIPFVDGKIYRPGLYTPSPKTIVSMPGMAASCLE